LNGLALRAYSLILGFLKRSPIADGSA